MEIVGEGQEMADLPEFNLLHLYICGSFWGITDDIMGYMLNYKSVSMHSVLLQVCYKPESSWFSIVLSPLV